MAPQNLTGTQNRNQNITEKTLSRIRESRYRLSNFRIRIKRFNRGSLPSASTTKLGPWTKSSTSKGRIKSIFKSCQGVSLTVPYFGESRLNRKNIQYHDLQNRVRLDEGEFVKSHLIPFPMRGSEIKSITFR